MVAVAVRSRSLQLFKIEPFTGLIKQIVFESELLLKWWDNENSLLKKKKKKRAIRDKQRAVIFIIIINILLSFC